MIKARFQLCSRGKWFHRDVFLPIVPPPGTEVIKGGWSAKIPKSEQDDGDISISLDLNTDIFFFTLPLSYAPPSSQELIEIGWKEGSGETLDFYPE
jgi:hypothetical protein